MGKRTISMGLSVASIQSVIKELREYEKSLEYKCEQFVSRLAQIGENTTVKSVSQSPLGNNITITVNKSKVNNSEYKAVVIATGSVHQAEGREPFYTVLAVEFGTGIHYNKAPNPKANDLGLGVGTFPGQIHAFEDGWYYLGSDDQWHYTHGVKATMPMYHASVEIINEYKQIAKEVFR